MRRALWLALVMIAPLHHAAAAGALPRVGVGGVLRMGYGGVLLRAGIPFDYLTMAEQCSPTALARYDVVLQAGMSNEWEPWRVDAEAALAQFVAAGGKLVCEMGVRLPDVMSGWRLDAQWHYPKQTDRDFALVPGAGHERLRALLEPAQKWACGGPIAIVRSVPRRAEVLARFVKGPAKDKPAVLAYAFGRGRLIYFAPELSYMQGNWRGVYDDLILAAVADLTDGRVRRVWAAEAGDAVLPPEPPPASVKPVDGLVDLGEPGESGYALRVERPTNGASRRLVIADPGDGRTEIKLEPSRLSVADHGYELPVGAELRLVRTQRRLNLLLDGQGLVSLPRQGDPGHCYADQAAGITYQPLESLYFTDDFTKQGPLADPWRAPRGQWVCGGPHRLDSAVPGFAVRAWKGIARTGAWYWSEAAASVAVMPRSAGAVRLELGYTDGGNRLEAWLPVERGGGALVLWRGGQRQVLAEGLPPLARLQWSRVEIGQRDGQAWLSVDGERRFAKLTTPVAGELSLGVDRGDALFDDVLVSDADDATRARQAVHPARFDKGPEGLLDRDTWAHPAACWLPVAPGRFEYVGRLTGDFELTMPLRGDGTHLAIGSGNGTWGVWDGHLGEGGIRISRVKGWMTVRRYGGGQDATRQFPDPDPARPWIEFAGLQLAPGDLDLQADDVLEYVADQAPADFWATEGDWTVGSRWPCTPEYAWMIGSSMERATLWTKHAYRGPLTVWTYLGVRMQGRYATEEGEPFRRLRVTLSGNGRDAMSGYVVELGSDVEGLCRLYRFGKPRPGDEDFGRRPPVVATAQRYLASQREVHNFWGSLRIDLDGPRLRVFYQNQPLLDYTDPAPLPPGQVALWTQRNALVTPYFAVFGHADAKPAPMPRDRQDKRLETARNRLARPGYNPLPATHALARLMGWEHL